MPDALYTVACIVSAMIGWMLGGWMIGAVTRKALPPKSVNVIENIVLPEPTDDRWRRAKGIVSCSAFQCPHSVHKVAYELGQVVVRVGCKTPTSVDEIQVHGRKWDEYAHAVVDAQMQRVALAAIVDTDR